jgi:hypothetical protein
LKVFGGFNGFDALHCFHTEKKWCRRTMLSRGGWRNLTTLDVTKSLNCRGGSGYLNANLVEVKKGNVDIQD